MSFTILVGAFTQETGVTGQGAQIVFFLPLHCIVVLVKCWAVRIYGQRLSILLRSMLMNVSGEY